MTISVITQNRRKFKDCPVGLFIYNGSLCIKTKSTNVYVISNGISMSVPDDAEVIPCYCEGGSNNIPMTEKVTDGLFDGWKRSTHPSYALISFNRTYASEANALFGSSIKHRNPIRLTVSHAEIERGLNKDWYHSRGRIVEIEMSQSQFADAITSFGQGDGVPCTLLFTERDGRIPSCNYVNKTEQFSDEFTEHLEETKSRLEKSIEEIQNLFNTKKTLSKSDRERIMSVLRQAKLDISGNATYIYDSFAEQMDKTIQEAKGEIESFTQNKIQNITAMAIAEKSPETIKMIEEMKNPIEI